MEETSPPSCKKVNQLVGRSVGPSVRRSVSIVRDGKPNDIKGGRVCIYY